MKGEKKEMNILKDDSLRKKIAILGALSKEEIEELSKHLERKEYKKGERIFFQDSSPENIYIIESGEVDLVRRVGEEEYFLKKYRIGDCFGQIALLGIVANLGDCISISETSVLQLSKFSFHRLSKENSKLFTKLLLNITREVCRYNYFLTNKFVEKMEKNIF